jgi:hypothetical protein
MFGLISGAMEEALDTLNHLKDQVEVKRRGVNEEECKSHYMMKPKGIFSL